VSKLACDRYKHIKDALFEGNVLNFFNNKKIIFRQTSIKKVLKLHF